MWLASSRDWCGTGLLLSGWDPGCVGPDIVTERHGEAELLLVRWCCCVGGIGCCEVSVAPLAAGGKGWPFLSCSG